MNSIAKRDRLNTGKLSHASHDPFLADGVHDPKAQKHRKIPLSALIPFSCLATGIATFSLLMAAETAIAVQPNLRELSSSNLSAETTQTRPFLISQSVTGSLRSGDSGDAVANLQSQLTELGYYNGAIDSIFGTETEDAVIRFQQANSLEADGIVGSATQSAITQAVSQRNPPSDARAVLRRGDSGEQVSALQRRLAALRYYTGEITGIFGSETEQAVIAFQTANSLEPDGLVGSATQTALRSSGAIAAGGSPTTPPTPSPDDGILELNDEGDEVVALQTRLRDLGFDPGEIDGIFGQNTQQAVIRFQQAQGLTPADGRVGNDTRVALANPRPNQPPTTPQPPIAEVPPTPVTPTPGTSEQCDTPTGRFSVRDLQERLQARGFYEGPINGCLDERTRAAIAAARNPYGLNQTDFAR